MAAIVGLVWGFDLHTYVSKENLGKLETFIRSFGLWAPAVFALVYYFASLLFLSVVVLTVLGGVLFGKLWGSLLVIVVSTAAAQTGFWLAHRYGTRGVSTRRKNSGAIASLSEKLNSEIEHHGFRTFFVLRCLFLPYMPLSYAAGLVKKARARDFFWATLLTNAVFSPVFVFFGDALLQGPRALILPALLIALVLLVPRFVKILQKYLLSPKHL